MSLIQRITSRRLEDTINEGYKLALTGALSSGTDQIVFTAATNRAPIITGLSLTTSSGSSILVSVGFKNGSDATLTLFEAYITSGSGVSRMYPLGDWYRGRLNDSIVITTAGAVAYTLDSRITSEPTALNYVEHEFGGGASGHRGKAVFPDESGLARGQSEL